MNPPNSLKLASNGIRTLADACAVLSAILADTMTGAITTIQANTMTKTINANMNALAKGEIEIQVDHAGMLSARKKQPARKPPQRAGKRTPLADSFFRRPEKR